jgi:hypothetical protein
LCACIVGGLTDLPGDAEEFTMTDADVRLAHEHARDNHTDRQRVAGLRHAANLIDRDENLPAGQVARQTVKAVASRLRDDAATIERKMT